MSCILNIETSTNVCSVAVSNDAECIFNKEDYSGPHHNEQLGRFVDEALSFIDSHSLNLDAVAVVVALVPTQDCVLELLWQREFAMVVT